MRLRLLALAVPLAAGACINFDDVRQAYCDNNKGFCGAGGKGGGATGGGSGGGAMGGGTSSGGGSAGGGGVTGGGSGGGGGQVICRMPDGGFTDIPNVFDAGSPSAYFVDATSGNDGANGTTSTTPLKTLTYALTLAGSGDEIRLCKGTYVGPFTVMNNVSVRGGYSCDATWARTVNYGFTGFDAGFDGVNETVLTAPICNTVLSVFGTSVTRSTIYDGLTVQAPDCDAGASTAFAMAFDADAGPTVRNCKILGGGGLPLPAIGSGAVAVYRGAAPELGFDVISGGQGMSTNREGSVGVFLDQKPGPAWVHDSLISGGHGSGGDGSPGVIGYGSAGIVGFVASGTAPGEIVIERNFISGGSGSNPHTGPGAVWGSAGVSLETGAAQFRVDVRDNTISSGNGAAMQIEAVGLRANVIGGARLDVRRNTIDVVSRPGNAAGVYLNESNASAYVDDNTVRADGPSTNAALKLDSAQGAYVLNNTLFTAAGPALDLSGNTAYVTINRNIALTLSGAILSNTSSSCGTAYANLRNNVAAGAWPKMVTGCLPADTIDGAGGNASGNAAVTDGGVCSADGCRTRSRCVGARGCIGDLVQLDWTDEGLSGITQHTGWPIADHAPCEVFAGDMSPVMTVTDDLLGRDRANPPTVGALEAGCCGP